MENILVQFVHKGAQGRKGRKIGVLVATGAGEVGWSLCNRKAKDLFNDELGVRIAHGRALNKDTQNEIPVSLKRNFDAMIKRSARYFK